MAFRRGKGIYIVFFPPSEQKTCPLFNYKAKFCLTDVFFSVDFFFSFWVLCLFVIFYSLIYSLSADHQKGAVGKLEIKKNRGLEGE